MSWLLDKTAWYGAVLVALVWACPARATNGVVSSPNCNEAGFVSVFNTVDTSGGGTITFNCGVSPVTISFTDYQHVSGNDIIDGGNLVTFDGGNTFAFFQVFSGHSLTLNRLILQHGAFNASHALENFGTLSLNNVTVTNNVSTDTTILNSGTLSITSSTFSSNTITSAGTLEGAALRNDGGSAQIVASSFSGNSISGGGGAGGAINNSSGDLHVERATGAFAAIDAARMIRATHPPDLRAH